VAVALKQLVIYNSIDHVYIREDVSTVQYKIVCSTVYDPSKQLDCDWKVSSCYTY
jgi:hypothetical protein